MLTIYTKNLCVAGKAALIGNIFKSICLDIKAQYTLKQYETPKAECAIYLQGTINPIIMYPIFVVIY